MCHVEHCSVLSSLTPERMMVINRDDDIDDDNDTDDSNDGTLFERGLIA